MLEMTNDLLQCSWMLPAALVPRQSLGLHPQHPHGVHLLAAAPDLPNKHNVKILAQMDSLPTPRIRRCSVSRIFEPRRSRF